MGPQTQNMLASDVCFYPVVQLVGVLSNIAGFNVVISYLFVKDTKNVEICGQENKTLTHNLTIQK